jgi:hypothetical protein
VKEIFVRTYHLTPCLEGLLTYHQMAVAMYIITHEAAEGTEIDQAEIPHLALEQEWWRQMVWRRDRLHIPVKTSGAEGKQCFPSEPSEILCWIRA